MNKNVEPFIGEVLFGDGTRQEVNISPATFRLAKVFAGQMPGMLEGTGLNQIISNLPNIVAISRTDHDSLHQIDAARKRDESARQQAAFRLGQMDMRAAVCDLLRAEAKKVPGPDGFLIHELVDKIEGLKVLHENA